MRSLLGGLGSRARSRRRPIRGLPLDALQITMVSAPWKLALLGVALCMTAWPVRSVHSQEAAASPGRRVQGSVSATTGPIGGASVTVIGARQRVTTDTAGRFVLDEVPSGPQRLQATAPGYFPATLEIEVLGDRAVEIAFTLRAQSGERVLDVTGTLLDTSQARQDMVRRFAIKAEDRLGQSEIARTTASDAAAAVSSLPAVSIVDGRFAFVRGLGERYSQTLFNGQSLPSPEPDRKVVPLDLFPANLIESLAVTKAYSPSLPGEFAGGSIQVETIDVPEERFVKLGFSLEYLEGTSFNDFNSYPGDNLDRFTIDDSTRALPDLVPRIPVTATSGLTPETQQAIGRAFENVWSPQREIAPLDHKLSASYGDRLDLAELGALGVVAAINWSNKYERRAKETFRTVSNSGTQDAPIETIFSDFKLDTSTFEADLSAFLNLTYELNPAQRVGLRNFLTRSTTDRARIQDGVDFQAGQSIQVFNLRYVERMLYTAQLFGEHLLIGDTLLSWRASYAYAERDEPDNRSARYDQNDTTGEFIWRDIVQSGSRDYFFQEEDTYDLSLDYAIPFRPFGIPDRNPDPDRLQPEQRLQFGISHVTRTRDFEGRRFRFVQSPFGAPVDENGNPIDLTGPPESILSNPNINPNGFILRELTNPSDAYEAELTLLAPYVETSFRVTPWMRLAGGLRIEDYQQEVAGLDPNQGLTTITAEIDETTPMPAVNLTFELSELMNLRFGVSRTVSRPEFREMALFQFRDRAGGYAARGNPELEQAEIDHLDLRWEWFPQAGDLLSASVFYKEFRDPIEKVIVPTASDLIVTWENAEGAKLYGFEIEVRKSLGFIRPWLSNFSFMTNYAILDSEIEVSTNPMFVQTNDSRSLEGQPEFTFNVGLFYDNATSGWSWALLARRFGESISAVGSNGVDDETEQPRTDLDFTVARQIGRGTLGLSIENLLNEKYEWKQGPFTTREYKQGISVGLSYSIAF